MRITRWVPVLVLFAAACDSGEPAADAGAPDAGRPDAGPDGLCNPLEPSRCLLPWPSNVFTDEDPSTETGLRLHVDAPLLNARDTGDSIALADGFSRVGTLVAYFPVPIDVANAREVVHLILTEADHLERLREEPLRFETISTEDGQTILLAHPKRPLEAAADYAVVITDGLRGMDGGALSPTMPTRVALGLATPETDDERALADRYADLRALLTERSIDPAHVLQAWDFTTRSAEDPRRVLRFMRDASIAAVDSGAAGIEIYSVEVPTDAPEIACIVYGRLTNLPEYLDEDDGFVPDADGNPTPLGTRDSPFRVLVPAGTDDYRFVMYGHGTGGNERDDLFDRELAGLGIAKVNVRFYGWTDSDVLLTLANLQQLFAGSFAAAAFFAEALAHAAAIQHAMEGILGDVLRGAELSTTSMGTMPNPAAGRGPELSAPRVWVGGSQGGTAGLIYASLEPSVHHAVINVPGAAWSQWVWHSYLWDLLHDLELMRYRDDIDLATGLAIGQTNLDMVDGASWIDVQRADPTTFLIQESMGDPVLPNPGTEMVAVVAGAQQVGAVLEPIEGVPTATEVDGASGVTQFRTTETAVYDVHGFASRDTPAGDAAREQILAFLASVWAGDARIVVPTMCPGGDCDFTR
ncbi:MAG: hypothetical protein AB7S26_04230 [Sandaracinaceae bacterium]